MEGYCVKCKHAETIQNGKQTTTANGRLMMKGVCGKCGTTICRFLPNPAGKAAVKPKPKKAKKPKAKKV